MESLMDCKMRFVKFKNKNKNKVTIKAYQYFFFLLTKTPVTISPICLFLSWLSIKQLYIQQYSMQSISHHMDSLVLKKLQSSEDSRAFEIHVYLKNLLVIENFSWKLFDESHYYLFFSPYLCLLVVSLAKWWKIFLGEIFCSSH